MCELPIKLAVPGEFKEPARNRIPLVKTLLLILSLLVLINSTLLASQETKAKRVLVLASYKATAPVAHLWNRGIQSVFESQNFNQFDIDIEYLDLISFNDDRYIQLMRDKLRHKLLKFRPDLVVPIYNRALGFVLKHREDLFPGIPVVFAGVEQNYLKGWKTTPDVTGLFSFNSYKETLDLALNLHPGTKHVAVVSGAGKVGRTWGTNALEAFRTYEDRVEIVDLTGLPMKNILEKVANMPAQSVVTYITLLVDGDGNRFTAPESVSKIVQASSAPVYSFWDIVLGHGIVGGYLSSAEEKGKAVAGIALRVLSHENVINSLPIRERNSKYMFDWRQLKRWEISENRLPPGSIVRFKKFSVWDRYRGQISGIIALIVLQALIISYLMHQRRKRLRAEKFLEERLSFEQMLSELSSEFIRISTDEADSKILDGLSRIGTHMKANRSYLFRFNWDKTEFRISHLWEDEGIPKDQTVRGEIVRDIFPWLYENLIKGKDIIISDVAELPREAACREWDYCKRIGIQSFLILPIQVANAPLCAIGLDSIQIKRKWSMEVKERLRLIGEIFANAVERKHSESRTKATELKYRTVADYTYDWEYWSHIDGSLEYVSPSCERISGHSVQDFKENPALLREIIVPEDKKTWDAHTLKSGKKFIPGEVQIRIRRKDGKIRWIEHVCQPVTDPQGTLLGLRASNRDITERKQAELDAQRHRAELTHVSRIATLGELSASLAHELNQPLTAILSNAQAARRFLTGDQADPDEVNEILNDIINDDKRAADMIKRLRSLMRRKELAFTSLDLNKVVRGVAELVNREAFTKNVLLVLDLAEGLPYVQGDAIHLQQVALNLIINGTEAMETADHPSGELRILTAKHDKNAVRVSVRDQGTGIDEDHITGIFEAFYTTKSEGMGMGLSICRSIIEAHGGQLWAENNPDRGATVSFTVPISK